jgi:transposase
MKRKYDDPEERREDRIDCAQFCTGLWHSLFNLATL